MVEYTNQMMLFKELSGKKVQVDFNGGQISSDAGVLLLRETEDKIGLVKRIAALIPEQRHTSYVKHDLIQLLTQRVFQVVCGYEDGNDSNFLRHDPLFKIGCNKNPISEDTLASQPTMCRFENAPSRTTLYRIAKGIFDHFIDSYSKPPEGIILDIDETDSTTYGSQQMSLFNGYYDSYCYQPIHVYEGHSGKLITSILRPGKRPSGAEITMILARLAKNIREKWPLTGILFRGDSTYSAPAIFNCCEQYNLKFAVGLKSNKVLSDRIQSYLQKAEELYKLRKETIRIYTEFEYKAKSWPRSYRVIAKIEINDKGPSIRFIATCLTHKDRRFIYETIYCGRGALELKIKELKNHLGSDRTSCSSFLANQFRLLIHSIAYILLHAFREKYLAGTAFAKAQFDTIRLKILKIGARVLPLTTKIKVHLATGCPEKVTFYQSYLSLCSP
jgi:hypothetical protein